MDIFEIGVIYTKNETGQLIPLSGWHVNTLQPIQYADRFKIEVDTPKVGFLGVPQENVLYYRFDSKEQASSYINTNIGE